MGLFDSIEERALEFMEDKFRMEQELDEKTLIYTTKTYIDDKLFNTHELDLGPMMDLMEKRILKKLKDKK